MNLQNNIRIYDELLYQTRLLNPNWHITLTWNTNSRTQSIEILNSRVKEIMAAFVRSARGRNWCRKHLPFIMVAEKHADDTLHAHIVLSAPGFDLDTLYHLFYISEKPTCTSWPEVYITPVCDKTATYILKQIKPDWTGAIDTTSWICSDILLELNHKKKRHRVKGYQKYNTKVHNHIQMLPVEPYSSGGLA